MELQPDCRRIKQNAAANRFYYRNKQPILQAAREYYMQNSEVKKAQTKAWRKANPNKVKSYRIAKYGLSLEQYDALLKLQNNRYAICNSELDFGKHTHIDRVKDSIATLSNAIEYLKGFL